MARHRPQGWWYPWTFVVGMLVVVAVNVVLITYAIGTFPGLDTEDAYRKGITYNQTLAAAHEQEARGWQADIQFHSADEPPTGTPGETGAGRSGDLTVSLTDRVGIPVTELSVSAVFRRPTHTGEDVTIPLDRRGAGRFGASVTLPHPGQWDAWIRASGPAGQFQTTQRIFVP